MPELPEVEVLVRHLGSRLAGCRIGKVQVLQGKAVRPHNPAALVGALLGARFQEVKRRGKFLLFELVSKGGKPLLLMGHLGMTGRMYLAARGTSLPRHAAVCLELEQKQLVFEDVRRFGRLTLEAASLARLGPEPLERKFTADFLQAQLGGSRQAIKVRLMDQRVVAGVGNIYASEALWRAGLSPRKVSRRLNAEECRRLWRALRACLREAIAWGSTIPLDFAGREQGEKLFYYGVSGAEAGYCHERLRVYDREGLPCLRCATPVRRITQAGRSTFYCPACQR